MEIGSFNIVDLFLDETKENLNEEIWMNLYLCIYYRDLRQKFPLIIFGKVSIFETLVIESLW